MDTEEKSGEESDKSDVEDSRLDAVKQQQAEKEDGTCLVPMDLEDQIVVNYTKETT